jgi:hypothetical protein
MRVTLEIDDDVLQKARDLARLKKQSPDHAISDLIRRGLSRETPKVEVRNGIPVWVHNRTPVPISEDLVRNLAEEDPHST